MSNSTPNEPVWGNSDSQGQGYEPAPTAHSYQQDSQPAWQAPPASVPNPASSAPSYGGYVPQQPAPEQPVYSPSAGYAPNGYASGYQGSASAAGYGVQKSGTNLLAILSLVASVVGFLFLWVIGPIAGIVMAHMARKQIAETGEEGAGLATAGWWVGWVGLALQALLFIGWIFLFVIALSAGYSSY